MRPDSACVSDVAPSPNHNERRRGIDALVLHYTGMSSGAAALTRLRDPASDVSSHYLVWENGRTTQLVPETCRAWHAGVSSWAGETDMNSASIGIEIVNQGHDGGCPAFPAPQVAAVVALCRDILERRPIPAPRVLAHSDIAPHRKIDPGEWFPWHQLAAAGIGLWLEPTPPGSGPVLQLGDAGAAVETLRADLLRFGYGLAASGGYDEEFCAVVAAFQRHYRPARVDGRADASTRETLAALLQRAA